MSGQKYLAGIDIGTTGAKTIIFDPEGNAVGSGYVEYPCIYPRPTWVEQDAELLIQSAFRSCRAALRESGVKPEDILAVGASTQRACALFVDREDKPLYLMSWQDSRTTDEVGEIRAKITDRNFYSITGMTNKPMWMVSKLLYVRNKRPEIWERTVKVIQVQDYLLKCLGADGYYSDESEAALTGTQTLLDLYCGTGTIGLTMAHRVKELIGVETVPEAIEDARKNALENGIQNARFLCADAAQAARQLEEQHIRPQVVILDPPRKGCDEELIGILSRMGPDRIVYVSCDPATLARDLARFQQKNYTVVRVTPVDMFPRTAHVECVSLLVKNKPIQ